MKGSVKSIRLSGKTTVTNGQSTKVTAAVTSQGGSANRSLAWSSSNTKLATVDKYGKVKTIKGKKVQLPSLPKQQTDLERKQHSRSASNNILSFTDRYYYIKKYPGGFSYDTGSVQDIFIVLHIWLSFCPKTILFL